jgi:hypothetical protein
MSIRGTITIECDSCDGELVLDDRDIDVFPQKRGGLELTAYAAEWVEDEDGLLHCPQCCEERDEAYERAAARARNNDFADTGGKDWT